MKEVRPIGFAHLMPGLNANWRQGAGLASSDLAVTTLAGSVVRAIGGLGITSDGKLCGKTHALSGGTSTNVRCLSQIPLSNLIGTRDDYTSFVIGFRFKHLMPFATTGIPILGLKYLLTTTDGNVSPDWHMWVSDSTGVLKPEGYYEFEYFPYKSGGLNRVDIYLDGVKIGQTAVAADSRLGAANLKNLIFCFHGTSWDLWAGTVVDSVAWTIEDMYAAWTNEEGVSVRQGPIKVRQLPVASVDTPAWVSSDNSKSQVEVLNLPNHSGSTLTPTLTSDAINTPLRVKIDSSGLRATDQVLGISGAVSARRQTGQATTYSAKWSHSSGDSASVSAIPTNGTWDAQADVKLVHLNTTPGGAALNKTTVGQLELVITPNG